MDLKFIQIKHYFQMRRQDSLETIASTSYQGQGYESFNKQILSSFSQTFEQYQIAFNKENNWLKKLQIYRSMLSSQKQAEQGILTSTNIEKLEFKKIWEKKQIMNLKAFPFDDIYALIDDKVEKLVLIITKINSQKFQNLLRDTTLKYHINLMNFFNSTYNKKNSLRKGELSLYFLLRIHNLDQIILLEKQIVNQCDKNLQEFIERVKISLKNYKENTMSLVDKYFENYSKFTSKKKKQSKYIIRAILLSIEKEIHENSLSLTIFQILFNYFIYMAEKIKAKKYQRSEKRYESFLSNMKKIKWPREKYYIQFSNWLLEIFKVRSILAALSLKS